MNLVKKELACGKTNDLAWLSKFRATDSFKVGVCDKMAEGFDKMTMLLVKFDKMSVTGSDVVQKLNGDW